MPWKSSCPRNAFSGEIYMAINVTTADELLSTTRAVRKRLDFSRLVPRQVILDCVRVSQQAPTGGNGQAWRWIVVEEACKRHRLAELYRAGAGSYLSQSREAALQRGDEQTGRVYESAQFLADHLHEVPVHVIPCQKGTPYPGHEGSFYASIYPAVWSFQLALRARGLGTVLTTLLAAQSKETAQVLGIPEDVTICALLPVAYTIGADFKAVARPDPATIVHWNGWNEE
jgi:nitroreductase